MRPNPNAINARTRPETHAFVKFELGRSTLIFPTNRAFNANLAIYIDSLSSTKSPSNTPNTQFGLSSPAYSIEANDHHRPVLTRFFIDSGNSNAHSLRNPVLIESRMFNSTNKGLIDTYFVDLNSRVRQGIWDELGINLSI
ncbi:hypothetical protein L1987_17712 [Smallanthus sonchifolius]|uniref:Uncharacterized protein n=1 Tax=Smallanthus sonchifolius TaxID=185202 RepID=A0ACB9IY92_9ASTR|nr:hypothetical protein L1987_17712 [Smallanthus sonchifolius]